MIRDEIIHLKLADRNQYLKARLITYKDPLTGHVLKFLSNLFLYQATTITSLYKNRWSMEVLFKRLKQNFELSYFYSDSPEGIKTQLWIG
ncbi:MAG: transposase [Cyclobacteriaceae bacterium]|nr:transposase [Cyclobacteriaceae bacterium]